MTAPDEASERPDWIMPLPSGLTDEEPVAEVSWPPKTIMRWIQGGTVQTHELIAELREWLAHFEDAES